LLLFDRPAATWQIPLLLLRSTGHASGRWPIGSDAWVQSRNSAGTTKLFGGNLVLALAASILVCALAIFFLKVVVLR